MNPQTQPDDSSGGHVEFTPGETISPRTVATPVVSASPPPSTSLPGSASEPVAFSPPAPNPPSVQPADAGPAETLNPPSFAVATPQAPTVPAPSQSFFRDDSLAEAVAPDERQFVDPNKGDFAAMAQAAAEPAITWTASEFIAHHKAASWYITLAGGALAAAFLMYLITRDVVSTGVVIFGAIIFGVSASRQPRQLQYALDSHGLGVGNKVYPYHEFRTFSVVDEGSFSSITFTPLKRFAPAISIYYDPADEDLIIDALADHLPMQEYSHDPIDKLMRRIRF